MYLRVSRSSFCSILLHSSSSSLCSLTLFRLSSLLASYIFLSPARTFALLRHAHLPLSSTTRDLKRKIPSNSSHPFLPLLFLVSSLARSFYSSASCSSLLCLPVSCFLLLPLSVCLLPDPSPARPRLPSSPRGCDASAFSPFLCRAAFAVLTLGSPAVPQERKYRGAAEIGTVEFSRVG